MFLPDIDQGLYTAMKNAPAVTAIVGTDIFNGVVPTARAKAFPRITIGNATDRAATSSEGSTLGRDTGRTVEQVHLWSQLSRSQLLDLYTAIRDAVNNQPLALPNSTQWLSGTIEWVTDMLDPDGITQHAVLRYTGMARR